MPHAQITQNSFMGKYGNIQGTYEVASINDVAKIAVNRLRNEQFRMITVP